MGSRRRFKLVARYGVAVLLTAVAARQVWLAHRHALTPWVGGGMGMFASTDRPDYRSTRVTIVTPDGLELPVRDRLADDQWPTERRAQILPSDHRLDALARALARRTWRVDTAPDAPAATWRDDATGPPLKVAAIRVEIRRVGFDPGRRAATVSTLRTHTHRIDGGAR